MALELGARWNKPTGHSLVRAVTAPFSGDVLQSLLHQLADQCLRTEMTFDQGAGQVFQLSDVSAVVDLPDS